MVDQELETTFRFTPPVKPSREIKPFFRHEKARRILRRPESPNDLR